MVSEFIVGASDDVFGSSLGEGAERCTALTIRTGLRMTVGGNDGAVNDASKYFVVLISESGEGGDRDASAGGGGGGGCLDDKSLHERLEKKKKIDER